MGSSKKKANISVFLDDDGKITRIPVPNRTRVPVLRYLAGKFEEDRTYTEKEVNLIIDAWHSFGDYFILRRLLVDYRFLARTVDGSKYWLVKKDDDAEGIAGWTEKRS